MKGLRRDMKQALAYRLGSFLLALGIATEILARLRDTPLSSGEISLVTSATLQVTHTIYYIVFHRFWRREKETPCDKKLALCQELKYAAWLKGLKQGFMWGRIDDGT